MTDDTTKPRSVIDGHELTEAELEPVLVTETGTGTLPPDVAAGALDADDIEALLTHPGYAQPLTAVEAPADGSWASVSNDPEATR